MPAVRAVIGHVTVETAKRRRICWRHRKGKAVHPIVKGEVCLVVKDGNGTTANYCTEAARDILQRAEDDLAQLKVALGI
jgi:hypothetical protein